VYAIEARDTVTAEFVIGNIASRFNVPITARGRTNSDYGVDTLALLIPAFAPLLGQSVTLWGTPWSDEHDKWRLDAATFFSTAKGEIPLSGLPPGDAQSYDPGNPEYQDAEGNPLPIQPFFTNPTECSGEELTTVVDVDSWQNPVSKGGEWVTGETIAPPVTGCEKLEFDPEIALRPSVDVADSPSGIDVRLETPQNNDPPGPLATNPSDSGGAPAFWRTPAGLATAHLKDTTVRLPEGTSFNPSAANGLRGCTQEQVGATDLSPKVTFDNEPHQCPDTAKIGTLEIVSPLLPDPLKGAVYAAPQHDNPFPGALTAIYMVAQDTERGLSIKLPGKVDLDEQTGQIATSFIDNPQLPFDSFELHFKSGPRAPLNTPPVCGQFKNSSTFTPWSHPHSGPPALVEDPFDITGTPNGQPCATEPEDRQFAPGFEAGSTETRAGAHTSFALNVTRRDGDQELSGITLEMPPGLTARLAGTPYCPDAALAVIEGPRTGLEESNGSLCPAASELGAVHTLAGAGPLPLPTSGRLYLAGPYAGAPLSIAAVVPAIAGGVPGNPAFDLGNVVVRSAAHLDPRTAQVKVRSAPLPYIVGGVPLRVRRVSVQITKPGFMLNPTNCEQMALGAQIQGAGDPLVPGDESAAGASSPFQVGNCAALGFKPRLNIRLFGKTNRGANQRLKAVLTPRAGDANIGRAAVTLPNSAFLDQEHIKTICTRVQWAADACPQGSIYGRATAYSPLLDYPLSGNVYLRSSDNNLPDMVADLRGPTHQPIRVELVGRIDSIKVKGGFGIRSTFDTAPDAPVSRFVLEMFGGKRSLIVNSRNICRGKNKARVRLSAHNGRRENFRPVVANPRCKAQRGGKAGKKRAGKHRRAAGKGRGQNRR
jgi:hypothetical protein